MILLFGLSVSIQSFAAEQKTQNGAFFSSGEGLNFSRGGAIRMPVFSSVDGYVVFRFSAQKVEPAQRRVGLFSVPQHGYAMDSVRLDFLSGALSPADWAEILKFCERLQQMNRTGSIEVQLPDARLVQTGDLLVVDNTLLIRPEGEESSSLLRVARKKESGRIAYSTLQLKPDAQL